MSKSTKKKAIKKRQKTLWESEIESQLISISNELMYIHLRLDRLDTRTGATTRDRVYESNETIRKAGAVQEKD